MKLIYKIGAFVVTVFLGAASLGDTPNCRDVLRTSPMPRTDRTYWQQMKLDLIRQYNAYPLEELLIANDAEIRAYQQALGEANAPAGRALLERELVLAKLALLDPEWVIPSKVLPSPLGTTKQFLKQVKATRLIIDSMDADPFQIQSTWIPFQKRDSFEEKLDYLTSVFKSYSITEGWLAKMTFMLEAGYWDHKNKVAVPAQRLTPLNAVMADAWRVLDYRLEELEKKSTFRERRQYKEVIKKLRSAIVSARRIYESVELYIREYHSFQSQVLSGPWEEILKKE